MRMPLGSVTTVEGAPKRVVQVLFSSEDNEKHILKLHHKPFPKNYPPTGFYPL